ncbi:MAG: universal stress protein, partial [Anaerolineales bacterium]|nr:universal stress protein [Anaerolineales bacterium]
LEPALAIAKSMDARILLFRVAQRIPRTKALAEMPDVYNDVVEASHWEAEEYLKQIRDSLDYDKISIEYQPATESVAALILDYALENEVDLIVISSHGRTGAQRWMFGSVAEKILNGACCATMIIRDANEVK